MKQRNESRDTEREKLMSETTDKAMKNYEQIVRAGLKIQEEASRCWTSVLAQGASIRDWQRPASTFASVANDVLPEAQRGMQEFLGLAEKNTRTSMELVRKAAEAMQTTGIVEGQAKWMDFWATSMGAARSNADAMMHMGSYALDTWINFVRKNGEIAGRREAKQSKTS